MTDEVKAPLRSARFLAAAWGCFLLAVTSWPKPPDVTAAGLPLDKLTHFGLYAVEGFLLLRAVRWPARARSAFARALAIVGFLALVGVLDEAHQEWIPGRKMDVADFAADVAGAFVGAVVGTVVGGLTSGPPPSHRPRRSESAD
jgi:VanZ family protein